MTMQCLDGVNRQKSFKKIQNPDDTDCFAIFFF